MEIKLEQHGCGSSICAMYQTRGQRVNGPCMCFPRSTMYPEERIALRAKLHALRDYVRRLEDTLRLAGPPTLESWDANGSPVDK